MLYADFGISPRGNEIHFSFGIHPNSTHAYQVVLLLNKLKGMQTGMKSNRIDIHLVIYEGFLFSCGGTSNVIVCVCLYNFFLENVLDIVIFHTMCILTVLQYRKVCVIVMRDIIRYKKINQITQLDPVEHSVIRLSYLFMCAAIYFQTPTGFFERPGHFSSRYKALRRSQNFVNGPWI